ncbi:MAG TPA: MgtC/SapB family protein [Sphingobacteriaceae bacterium]|nr:MgtC/SapB family protein [Sphingobacteriaceae bacterium]
MTWEWLDIGLRLLAGVLLSGLIGWERETLQRPAGLRTHMLVGVGATLIMIVSTSMVGVGPAGAADPGRIAAQVVSGIGFLGAGTILREGVTVRGLTTAASLWVVAAIGLAAGAGFYLGAVATTGIALATLIYARVIEHRMTGGRTRLFLEVRDGTGALGEIASVLGQHQIDIRQVEIRNSEDPGNVILFFSVMAPSQQATLAAMEDLSSLDSVLSLQLD